MTLVLLFAGLLTLVAGLLGGRGGSGKAARRRLEAVRLRHAPGSVVETQFRRVTAQQASAMDARIHRLLPRPELLRRRIAAAGRSWTLARYAAGCGGLGLGVALLLLLRGAPLLLCLFAGVVAGLGLPHWWLGRAAKKRIVKFLARFPDAIELLVRGLRAGLPVSETMQVVGAELPDPVGGEFRGVADRMRIGRTMESALQDTAEKLGTPEFQFFVITLAIQRETGGNLAETLGNLADVLRKRLQMKLKVRAMSSESKASAYIIGAMPFLVFVLFYIMNPAYMGRFFVDTRLMVAAVGGFLWMGIGIVVMAKMVAFEI